MTTKKPRVRALGWKRLPRFLTFAAFSFSCSAYLLSDLFFVDKILTILATLFDGGYGNKTLIIGIALEEADQGVMGAGVDYDCGVTGIAAHVVGRIPHRVSEVRIAGANLATAAGCGVNCASAVGKQNRTRMAA